MKTKILTALSICFVFVLMVSCISRKPERQTLPEPIVIENIKTVEKETIVRDTIFRTEKDSALYEAYIKCRDGKATLTKPLSQKGENKGKIFANVSITDNRLTLKVEKPPEELRTKIIEKQTKETQPKMVYVEKPIYIEKPFAWYHKALMWVGGIFILIVGVKFILSIKSKI